MSLWDTFLYWVESSILYYMTVIVVGSAVVIVAYCCCRNTGEEAPPLRLTLDEHYRMILAEAAVSSSPSGAHLLAKDMMPLPPNISGSQLLKLPQPPVWEDQLDSKARSSPVHMLQCEPGPDEDTIMRFTPELVKKSVTFSSPTK
ncbi:unnamed protein product [Meganyctiphanes norvegica]|uniref:Uncharacterized protein n=1 Tax=Meganyctiphanes norvegica TaxID=48144 RepID=A0AAV2RBW5_MEGNR